MINNSNTQRLKVMYVGIKVRMLTFFPFKMLTLSHLNKLKMSK